MKKYSLQRVGNLLLTRGAVKGPQGIKVMNLLVDTGSTYTILPVEVLESVGQSTVELHFALHGSDRWSFGNGFPIKNKGAS